MYTCGFCSSAPIIKKILPMNLPHAARIMKGCDNPRIVLRAHEGGGVLENMWTKPAGRVFAVVLLLVAAIVAVVMVLSVSLLRYDGKTQQEGSCHREVMENQGCQTNRLRVYYLRLSCETQMHPKALICTLGCICCMEIIRNTPNRPLMNALPRDCL